MLKLKPWLSVVLSISVLPAAMADWEHGRELHADQCIDCHMMRDHSALYIRKDRIVDSLQALGGQVSACIQALDISWFPEEEQNVVEYLDTTYYKFSK